MHAARREMIEETGYDADTILELGKVHPNPAIQGNICFSYVAENLREIGRIDMQGAEETEVALIPMTEIPNLIASAGIMHALTIAAFSFLHVYNPQSPRRLLK
jgi:ADP-ribose pyrophosphatase